MNTYYARHGSAPGAKQLPLKLMKREGVYRASNVTFNPKTMEARSYYWWIFVKRIGKKLVFNNFRYSPSTQRHQRKVLDLLNALGIEVDLHIDCPGGLQNLESAVRYYRGVIQELENEISKKGSKRAKNALRHERINDMRIKIRAVERLMKYEQGNN